MPETFTVILSGLALGFAIAAVRRSWIAADRIRDMEKDLERLRREVERRKEV